MADWEALRTRLQQEFGLDVDQEDELAVTVGRESAEGQQRAQRVMLSPLPGLRDHHARVPQRVR